MNIVRILIIEDDKNLCQIMRAGLQDAGIDSDFCHDGETGLELLLHNCYDACCLDRMLPSLQLFALNSPHVCETSVIFFVFRYTSLL